MKGCHRSFLERKSVQPATELDYKERLDLYRSWAAAHRIDDSAAVAYLEMLFFEGRHVSDGNRFLSAVPMHRPDLKQGLRDLPRARLAAKGFRRLAPPAARLPLPFLALAPMIAEMVRSKRYEAAAATALCLVLMLRPSEVLRARRMDLIPPALGQKGRSASWSLVLHAAELGVTSKVGDQDESILLDLPIARSIAPWCEARRANGRPLSALLEISYLTWRHDF